MRLMYKWLLISLGGGLLVTFALSTLPERLIDAPENKLHPILDKALEIVFWPMAVCVHLSGPGAPIGPREKHMYEATPVQVLATFVGIGLSWVFYSSLVFVIIWIRKHRSRGQIPACR